ncbi:amidase [Ramlibacter henchirensis]|uniref:Amidase n=1 Tax=Ramlibacter henchirensis TaxID=204072 RepID=A0A4Z0BX32_9BURK|nr:amidase [Ramlibacter henchirensis]TFZ02575.1 amidase [Ramlibacter henchirensis]
MDIHYASAVELAAGIRERRFSSRELLETFLKRVEALDGRINAIVVRDFERARAAADEADAALARGDVRGPLHGVPMTVKESFDVEGLPTSWGVPALKDNIASSTAVSVRRLQDAGAVVFGKTNIALLLADYQSANENYGTTSNPWDLSRTCGGSSGGSAAALAAGLVGFEWGSDIGGSLRVPAHYCGIYSHKPTWGVIPPAGHWISPGPRTDVSVPGPMARSATDLELGLKLTAGPDGADARALRLELPACPHKSVRDFRVAVMSDCPEAEVDDEIRTAVDAVARHLAAEGAKVSQARPDLDYRQLARNDVPLFFRATTSGRVPDAEYERLLRERTTLDPADDRPYERYVRAVTATHRDWLQANMRRYAMQQAWERFFGDWDVLICPTAATTAFRHDPTPMLERTVQVNGRAQPVADQMFWAGLVGIPYLPATVVPAARSREGLPIGVQIVARQYGDLTSIALARLLEQGFRRFEPPPQP